MRIARNVALAALSVFVLTDAVRAQPQLPTAPVRSAPGAAVAVAPYGSERALGAPKEPADACPPTEYTGAHGGEREPVDWLKVPPITATPRAGWFTIRPSGPGYYTLFDLVHGDLRPEAPPAPFGLTSSNQTPSYDHDFRYLEKPDNAYHLWSDAYKRVHIGENFLFSTGGEMRYRFNDYTSRDAVGKNDVFDLTRLRAYSDFWYRDRFRLFVEMIDARTYNQDLPPGLTDATGTDLLNAFVELKMADLAGSPVQIRGGRQEIVLGSQRLIASPDFSNTLRTYDGVRAYWHSQKWSVDAFWVRPVIPNPKRFDSSDNQRAFSGIYVTHRPNASTLIDLYLLNLNSTLLNSTVAVGKGDVTTFGGRFAGDVNKRLLYDFEAGAQTGDSAGRTVNAQFGTAGLGWHFADLPWNISFWTYYDYATGTQDPVSGNVNRTFNQLFAAGHTYFGYIDLVGRQNIKDLNFQLEMNPQPWLQLRAQYHIFQLAATKDFLYNASGAPIRRDPTGAAGNNVGNEIDLLANFHISPHQDILLGYSHLYSGRFLRSTGPGNDPAYFYAQYTFRW